METTAIVIRSVLVLVLSSALAYVVLGSTKLGGNRTDRNYAIIIPISVMWFGQILGLTLEIQVAETGLLNLQSEWVGFLAFFSGLSVPIIYWLSLLCLMFATVLKSTRT